MAIMTYLDNQREAKMIVLSSFCRAMAKLKRGWQARRKLEVEYTTRSTAWIITSISM